MSLAELKVIVAENDVVNSPFIDPSSTGDSDPAQLVAMVQRRRAHEPKWSRGRMALCACVALFVGCSPMLLLTVSMVFFSISSSAAGADAVDGDCHDIGASGVRRGGVSGNMTDGQGESAGSRPCRTRRAGGGRGGGGRRTPPEG